MKSKKAKITLIIVSIFLVLLLTACVIFFIRQYNKTTFYQDTTINGLDVSDLTPAQVFHLLSDDYDSLSVTLHEGETIWLTGKLDTFGYTLDTDTLKKDLNALQSSQKGNLFVFLQSLLKGNTFNVDIHFLYDKNTLLENISQVFPEDQMTVTADAYMEFNEETNRYEIVPEVYGTQFDVSQLIQRIEAQLSSYVADGMPSEDLDLEFPKELYTLPTVTSDNKEMVSLCNIYNQYCGSRITYQFGSQTQVLDWDTIQTWLIIEDQKASLNQDAIAAYVSEMAGTYNTLYRSRTFKTSTGETITIPGNLNEYGYKINEEAEIQQLIQDIESNTAIEREPVYVSVDQDWGNPYYYKREGTDDLAGTYIEVNLTTQHLWFYKNGSLIIESDLVSGCVSKGTETQTGCFPIAYKESPSILTGGNAENGYSEEVAFWMAFFEGQGLHDASWRSEFGGDIYLENGSHGCVNLPYETAETIYNNSTAGMAIILYK